MAKATLGARLLLGMIFLIFGINGLMMIFAGTGFIPMPPKPPLMQEVMGGLFASIYLMPLVKILEVVGGLFLISNKYVNLGLVLLGPIVVNILLLHVFVDISGLMVGVVVTLLYLIIVKSKWDDFKFLLNK